MKKTSSKVSALLGDFVFCVGNESTIKKKKKKPTCYYIIIPFYNASTSTMNKLFLKSSTTKPTFKFIC